MKTILVFSSDDALVGRIRGELRNEERVECHADLPLDRLRIAARDVVAVVVDCRSNERADVVDALARVRQHVNEGIRCIAIFGADQRWDVDVVGYLGDQARTSSSPTVSQSGFSSGRS
jgi:hypothetical protein